MAQNNKKKNEIMKNSKVSLRIGKGGKGYANKYID
jgi:hypothetical protein